MVIARFLREQNLQALLRRQHVLDCLNPLKRSIRSEFEDYVLRSHKAKLEERRPLASTYAG